MYIYIHQKIRQVMGDIIRLEYYVGLDKSMWSEVKATNVSVVGSEIKYTLGFDEYTTTELFLEDIKVINSEGMQDKNINRKNFNFKFHTVCFKKDTKKAKSKLKRKVILLLTKHQNKIEKLMSNL